MPTPKSGYFIDGVKVPSVTTVLGICAFTPSDALCGWAAKCEREGKRWKEVRNRAGYVGTAVHAACEGWPNDPIRADDMTDAEWERVIAAWTSYGEWRKRQRAVVMLQEVQLTSRELRSGGTPDLLVRMPDGKVYLTDHKSSKSLDPKAIAQVAAYAHMVTENTGNIIDGAIVFHYPAPKKDGDKPGFNVVPVGPAALAKGLEAFRAARALYDLQGDLRSAVGPETLSAAA